MSIRPEALIDLFQKALAENWGYIYGTAGSEWTQSKQDKATDKMIRQYGQQWVGHRVADCSGLFSWAFKALGGSMYHGSNTMFRKYCINTGELKNATRTDGQLLKPGTALFKYNITDGYHHVGLFIGNGVIIEAKGTAYGVVSSSISGGWTHWGELKGIDYEDGGDELLNEILYYAKVTTKSGSLNVRASCSKNAAVLGKLEKGSTVSVISQTSEWLKVQSDSLVGWCDSSFLTKLTNDATHVLITDSIGNTFTPIGNFSVEVVEQ